MISRSLMVPTLLVASVGVPYAVTNSPDWEETWNNLSSQGANYFASATTKQSAGQLPLPTNNPVPEFLSQLNPPDPQGAIYRVLSPLEGSHTISLAEVFRMDVTKEWVYGQWPRKSTGLANLNDYGVRVPLVTGTNITDLAGSLTYHFNQQGQVVRISFRGRTGDTTELVMLLTSRYQLQRESNTIPGTQLYQVKRGSDVISKLHTKPAAVLWSSSPHRSFDVELELQRPDGTPLPPEPVLSAKANQESALPQETANADSLPPNTSKDVPAGSAESKATKTADERWNNLFPRSRVSPKQIEYLQRMR